MAKKAGTANNPLVELLKCGQSVWYDNISRELIDSGELRRMVDEDGLRGVTSNPTIFEKAVTGSTVYKDDIQDLFRKGLSTKDVYETLAIQDIQAAADILRPVYDASAGVDGFVSLEVSPTLAYDTDGTIAEAKRLHERVDRKNVLIKVPSTPPGLPAIEQLIGAGISINVTLMFSTDHYVNVAAAYLRGLEALEKRGGPLDQVASVASVFVSRVDTAIDKILSANPEAWEYLGKAGIANAKAIYAKFKEVFNGPQFERLKQKGARVQRPLWASTGVKNPRYSDVLYAEELIGPHTVDTMPPATMAAFRDHAVVAPRLEKDIERGGWLLSELSQFGINLKEITEKLQTDGVESFSKSFEQLMKGIESQAEGAVCDFSKADLIRYRPWLNEVAQALEKNRAVQRVWEKDPSLWHHEPAHHVIIRNSLGWLDVADTMLGRVAELTVFADEVKASGITNVLLLGIGGSSLCPDVCRETFGIKAGYPDLTVLDSTDPGMISRCSKGLDLTKTLFLVSSKSGGTPESVYLQKYFYAKMRKLKGARAGDQFVAVTDPGTPLVRLAQEQQFRRVFLNFTDIVGRYAALSYFGMLPAALMGIDIRGILKSAQSMAMACGPSAPVLENPGALLGVGLGELARNGRDKLTLVLSPEISAYGYWIEQLVAESTGKAGRGILAVEGEELGDPGVYGRDRVFVALELAGENSGFEARLLKIENAGHPVVRITVPDAADLGGEFFRWEFATAIAGYVLGVDPFDQPDVQESKNNTKAAIERFRAKQKLAKSKAEPRKALASFLAQARECDYVALQAYIDRKPAHLAALQRLRTQIRDRCRVATTVGFGPRFLHSTGQLHKGGTNNGLFVQITADDRKDLKIPGEPFSFGILKQAQAMGDLGALRRNHRRVIHLHLGADIKGGIAKLEKTLG